jgi:hypothetical protein
MDNLVNNEKIVKALTNNVTDFLSGALIENASELLYDQICPYRKIESELEEAKSYITMSFRFGTDRNSQQIKNCIITFHIIVRNNLVKTTPNEGLRYDYLRSQIDETFNQLNMGIGKVAFIESDDQVFSLNHKGCYVKYIVTDFQ